MPKKDRIALETELGKSETKDQLPIIGKPIMIDDLTKAIPEWKANKNLHGSEITLIETKEDGSAELTMKMGHIECRYKVNVIYMEKNLPEVGDYFVTTRTAAKDGVESCMKAELFEELHDFANRMGFLRHELLNVRFRALEMCDANPRTDGNSRAACVRYEHLAHAAEAVLNALDTAGELNGQIERLTTEIDKIQYIMDALDDGDTDELVECADKLRDLKRERQTFKVQLL